MVIPLLRSADWSQRLGESECWNPSKSPMVVIAPHPDDETLGAGGLIFQQASLGVAVTVVAVTDGENAYEDNYGLASQRRGEQECALQKLGVSRERIVRLSFVDSGLRSQEDELIGRLRPFILPGCLVIAPWIGDFHPDHEVSARAAALVAEEAGAQVISYFFWTWHRGTLETIAGLNLLRYDLSVETQAIKDAALECHASQLSHGPEPEILPDRLLWPARMPFEVFSQ